MENVHVTKVGNGNTGAAAVIGMMQARRLLQVAALQECVCSNGGQTLSRPMIFDECFVLSRILVPSRRLRTRRSVTLGLPVAYGMTPLSINPNLKKKDIGRSIPERRIADQGWGMVSFGFDRKKSSLLHNFEF